VDPAHRPPPQHETLRTKGLRRLAADRSAVRRFPRNERTSEAKYLRTGDLCRVDDEGLLFAEGRQKDLIIVSGRNIYPQASKRARRKTAVGWELLLLFRTGLRTRIDRALVLCSEAIFFAVKCFLDIVTFVSLSPPFPFPSRLSSWCSRGVP